MFWPFTTELQGNGSKILRSSLIDNFGNLGVAGVENIIKPFF